MSTKADSDELVFIVDETHEDQKCERQSVECPKQAVWNVEWTGCCNRTQRFCLTCFDYLESFGPWSSGTIEANCTPHGGVSLAKRVYPVARSN